MALEQDGTLLMAQKMTLGLVFIIVAVCSGITMIEGVCHRVISVGCNLAMSEFERLNESMTRPDTSRNQGTENHAVGIILGDTNSLGSLG